MAETAVAVVAAWQQQRKCCSAGSAWWWRQQWQQQLGGSGSAMAAAAMGAVVFVPHLARRGFDALSANTPMHPHSNVTNTLTYAPSSFVEEGGTTVPTALSSATAAPVAMSAMVAVVQTTLKTTLTISFVKLNTFLN